MTEGYEQAKADRAKFEADVERAGAAVRELLVGVKRGPMGLTPDAVKFSPKYQAAKKAYVAAFGRLRFFNAALRKSFASEIKAERRKGR